MNDFLDLYDIVLYRGFYPWLKEQKVDHTKGADQRKAYYALLVQNEGKDFLNGLQQEIESAYNDYERIYLAHEALNVLEQKLERTALLISEYCMEVEISADTNVAARKYFLTLLKKELICLYLEVQERYTKHLKRNILSLEDIHWSFFRESVPERSMVVKENKADRNMVKLYVEEGLRVGALIVGGLSVGESLIEEPVVEEPIVEEAVVSYEEKSFEPIMCDTRPLVNGVLSYADIVAHKTKFAQLEKELFGYELLDTEYRFKRKPHGNVMKMAAVYRMAIQMGYFAKHYFRDKRRIAVTANDVRLFLNHRYDTNIERQFQNFSDKDVLNKFLERDVVFRLILTSSLDSL
jgi:hypothetical protein